MRKNSILYILVALLAFLVILPMALAGDEVLFIDVAHPVSVQEPGVTDARLIEINWNALNEGKNKKLELNLFEGSTISAVRDRLDSPIKGGYVWVGHVPGNSHSAVTLSVIDRTLIGSITLDGVQYTIRQDGARQILRQIDPKVQIEVELNDMVLLPEPTQRVPEKLSYCEDGSQIDLLVAYTKAARKKMGGTTAIKALINLRVSEMNSANANSGLNYRYNLAHVMEANYQETGNAEIDLPRLKRPGDGHLDDITKARDVYNADLTSLIISEARAGTSCGVAYVMNELSTNFASYAFNVASLDYAGTNLTCSPLTMAHELGHNMGNLHDRASTDSAPLLPYSYGYQSPNETFRTIMSYNCPGGCPRINYWSNPDISVSGEALGISYELESNRSADNARAMAQTALHVANFRENCPVAPMPTPTSSQPPGNLLTPTPPSSSSPFGYQSFFPILLNKRQ